MRRPFRIRSGTSRAARRRAWRTWKGLSLKTRKLLQRGAQSFRSMIPSKFLLEFVNNRFQGALVFAVGNDRDRLRHNRHDQHHKREDRQTEALTGYLGPLADLRMAEAADLEQYSPYKPSCPHEHGHRNQNQDHHPRDEAVSAGRNREHYVPAVELAAG